MYYVDGDPFSKPRMVHQRFSYDSVVLMKDTGAIRGLSINGEASYDSDVLTKNIGVIRGLPIDDDVLRKDT